MGKEYSVTFELFIKEYGPKKGYKDVIQLTASGGEGQIGDRNPSVFLTDNLNIHVGVSLNNNWNYHFNSPQSLKENKWYKVKLTQKLENGKVFFKTHYLLCLISNNNLYHFSMCLKPFWIIRVLKKLRIRIPENSKMLKSMLD